MSQTNSQVPSIVIANTLSGVDWTTPNNILIPDAQYAVSGGSTQILTVGYVGKINVPVGATVDDIIVSVKGYRGSYNTTLDIYAVDFSSGTAVYYLMTPSFQGFNGTNTLYTLTGTLFGNTWSVDAINNLGIRLIADGELYLDTVEVNVLYTPAVVPPTTTTIDYNTLTGGTFAVANTITGGTSGATGIVATDDGVSVMTLSAVVGTFIVGETISNGLGVTAIVADPTGQTVVDEFVQAQPFQLAQSITSTSLSMLLNSFNYPDGVTPIQISDFSGEALMTLDQGILGKEENVRIVDVQHNYGGSGLVYISFGTIANRGLGFKYPYTSVVGNRLDHSGTSEAVISNSAPFYNRFLKVAQIGALVSGPLTIKDEGVTKETAVTTIDFVGAGVTATKTSTGKIQVNIPGGGGGGITLQTDGVTNGDQALLNLKAGANVVLVDDGVGGITISSLGGGGGGSFQIDQTPDNGTYGLLAGAVNGVNTTFTVSLATYVSGKLLVFLNGLAQLQGASDDFVETTPGSGTFDFNTAPATGDIITVVYATSTGLTLQTEGVNNGDQTLLNLKAGTNMTITDDGLGGITFDATGGGGSGTAITQTITQTTHGFSVGDIIRSAGTAGAYTKAKADTPANAEVIGIVTTVTNANEFIVTTEGYFTTGVPAQAAGTIMFLSDSTAGALTATEPTTGTTVSKPIVTVITNAAIGYFHNYRGQNNQTISTLLGIFTNGTTTKNASDASTTQNIAHGLGVTPKKVKITALTANYPGGTIGMNTWIVNTVYNGTTQSSLSMYGYSGVTISTSFILNSADNSDTQTGVITCDSTNIIITWTKSGSPTGTFTILWEAEA